MIGAAVVVVVVVVVVAGNSRAPSKVPTPNPDPNPKISNNCRSSRLLITFSVDQGRYLFYWLLYLVQANIKKNKYILQTYYML